MNCGWVEVPPGGGQSVAEGAMLLRRVSGLPTGATGGKEQEAV